MFDILKKKIGGFISSITQRAEQKIDEEGKKARDEKKKEAARPAEKKPEPKREAKKPEPKPEKKQVQAPVSKPPEKTREQAKPPEKKAAQAKAPEPPPLKKETRKQEERQPQKPLPAPARAPAKKETPMQATKTIHPTEEPPELPIPSMVEEDIGEDERIDDAEPEQKKFAAQEAVEKEEEKPPAAAPEEKPPAAPAAEAGKKEEKKPGGLFSAFASAVSKPLGFFKKPSPPAGKKPEPETARKPTQTLQEREEQPEPEEKPSTPAEPKPIAKTIAPTIHVAQEKKSILPVSLSLESKLRGFIFNEIEIKHKDIDDLLETLEMSLLEADVTMDVAKVISEELQKRLVGKKVGKGKVEQEVSNAIKETLVSIMSKPHADLSALVKERKAQKLPMKVLFIGPNGAGKTTTMAKVAHLLMQQGFSCVFSASDTFRAAAIEQTVIHSERLGIKAVKHKYGADPAAVAFDAINYASAHGIDVVLIDSAGRQDTNANLLDELKKMVRVAKPDLKLFVGESIAGHAIVEQVRAFNEAVGLDGVILTKLDCDAKGGTALSITRETGVPIFFIGVGQEYGDLIAFDPRSLAEQIMS